MIANTETNQADARIAQSIRQWHERMTELEAICTKLSALLGSAPDSPMMAAIWSTASGYTNAVGQATGTGDWLEWWWLECDLGAKPLAASTNNEPMRTIATVDDLIRLALDEMRSP